MAYREHGMWEILEVLRRLHAGEGVRQVARGTGRTPKTVRRYVRLAGKLGWKAGAAQEPEESLACRVASRLRPGPPAGNETAAEALLLPVLDQLREWLAVDVPERRGLQLTKVHILLRRHGVDVGYSALHRFAQKHLDFGCHRITVRMADCEPGEVSEIDFGRLGYLYDQATGKRRLVYALVVTLVFSRHQYVYVTFSQKLVDVIEGLEQAWEFFGGCTSRVIIDNLRAAVAKADRYEPFFQRTFDEYARHRGFVIDAAVAYSPKQKPHVERQVPFVRENFFRGEQFLDLDDVQRRALHWCLGQAGLRTHGTTRKQPLAEFEQHERAALIPIVNPQHFDVPAWAEPKVHPDCHIRVGNALYSVPFAYKGKEVTVRRDSRLVRVYYGGQRIKLHPLQEAGGRSTDFADYPRHKSDYAMRDPDRIITQADAAAPTIGKFAARLLAGDFPWSRLRQGQALLRLVTKYGSARIEAACERALAFDLISVPRLRKMVERALETEAATPSASPHAPKVVQLPLRFGRPAASFLHAAASEPTTEIQTATAQEIIDGTETVS